MLTHLWNFLLIASLKSLKVPVAIKDDSSDSSSSSVVKIITPPKAHAACKKWIIFSDLHVKSSSIETCEMVLKQVHEESVKRNVSGWMYIFMFGMSGIFSDFSHIRDQNTHAMI